MYLKKAWIIFLKIKNRILLLVGLGFLLLGIGNMVSLTAYYWGDWNTIINARSTPEATSGAVFGAAVLVYISLSKRAIKNAAFYSSYFEGNLYGFITYEELSDITGYSPSYVRFSLFFLRYLYMKKFTFRRSEGGDYIELNSKKVVCRCKNCGAFIDKNVYFSGICPFCRTSDVFATVMTENRVYNIESDYKISGNNPGYYLCKNFKLRTTLFFIALSISSVIFLSITLFIISRLSNYNDQDYLKKVLLSGKSYTSYELIKKEILDGIIWGSFIAFIFFPIIVLSSKKLWLLFSAKRFSEFFAQSYAPYIDFRQIRSFGSAPIKKLRKTIQNRYLRNCSIERHENSLQLSLAKKILKDQCPYCGAPIAGVVNDNYVCNFCKNYIMQIVAKK